MGSEQENLQYIEELAQAFHQGYSRVFSATTWDKTRLEYRKAVTLGIRAVLATMEGQAPGSTKRRGNFPSQDSANANSK